MPATTATFPGQVESFLQRPEGFAAEGRRLRPTAIELRPEGRGRYIVASFGLADLASISEEHHVDRRDIPPPEFGTPVDLATARSDPATGGQSSQRFYLDSRPERIAEDLVIQRGETRYRFTFDAKDAESRRYETAFLQFLEEAFRAQRQARAGEARRIKAALNSLSERTADEGAAIHEAPAEVARRGREYVGELVAAGDRFAASARCWLGVYYLIGMLLFLGIFRGATILAGIGININQLARLSLGAALCIVAIEAMKQAVALSQRQYSISNYHRISAERLAAALRSGWRPTLKQLESGKKEVDERIQSVIEGCRPATTFWTDRTEAVDAALESNEYSWPIPTHG